MATYGFKPNNKQEDEGAIEAGAATMPVLKATPPPQGNPVYSGAWANQSAAAPAAAPAGEDLRQPVLKMGFDDPGEQAGPAGPKTTVQPKTVQQAAPYVPYKTDTMANSSAGSPAGPAAPAAGSNGKIGRDGGVVSGVADYSRDWLSAPSRYNIDAVESGMQTIRARMDEIRRQAMVSTNERLAGTGTLGSTRGEELHQMAQSEIDRQEQDQNFNLLREMAMTQGADRAAAGGYALDVAGFGENQYQFDEDLGFRNKQLGQQRSMFDDDLSFRRESLASDVSLRNRELELRQQGMSQEEARWQAEFEYGQERDTVGDQHWSADDAYRTSRAAEQDRQFGVDDSYRRDRAAEDDQRYDTDTQYRGERDKKMMALDLLRELGLEDADPKTIQKYLTQLGFGPDSISSVAGAPASQPMRVNWEDVILK